MTSLFLTLALFGQAASPPTPAERIKVAPDPARAGWVVAADDSGRKWALEDATELRRRVAALNLTLMKPGLPEIPLGDITPFDVMPGSEGPVVNWGVDTTRLSRDGREWYGGNGPPTTGAGSGEASAADRLHLTVIGPDARETLRRWRVDPGFRQAEEAMGDRLAVQAFADPSNPLVANVGLPRGGRPDVVIQSGDGRVLDRWKADPGPAAVVGELRRLDPRYRADQDPAGPTGGLGLDASVESTTAIGIAIVAAFLLIRGLRRA